MEIILRTALMFFFIQFVVILTVMVVALLLAQPEVPLLVRSDKHAKLSRCFARAVHLPEQAYRTVARRLHSVRGTR